MGSGLIRIDREGSLKPDIELDLRDEKGKRGKSLFGTNNACAKALRWDRREYKNQRRNWGWSRVVEI